MDEDKENRFLGFMHEEKLQSQQRRGNLISRKLGWVTGLFAIGGIQWTLGTEAQFDVKAVFYLIPIISLILICIYLEKITALKEWDVLSKRNYLIQLRQNGKFG